MSQHRIKYGNPGWILFAACLLSVSGCHRHEASPHRESLPTMEVKLGTVEASESEEFEKIMGTVRSKLKASIAAKITGRIDAITVETGQKVTRGTVLITLNAEEIVARQAQASAVLEQARSDLKRFTLLRQQEAVTQAEFDAIQARHGVAEATMMEAKSMLEYTKIAAPFDGVITHKWVEPGDLALPGKALLEIEDPTNLRLEAEVPEALIGRIAMKAQFSARVAYAPSAVQGIVSEIAPTGDPHSRTFLVKLDLPPAQELRAGQFGHVDIPTGRRTKILAPVTSVLERGQLEMVFVVREKIARMRLVKTGKVMEDRIELLSGVQPGDQIVLNPAPGLRDGQPVMPLP